MKYAIQCFIEAIIVLVVGAFLLFKVKPSIKIKKDSSETTKKKWLFGIKIINIVGCICSIILGVYFIVTRR